MNRYLALIPAAALALPAFWLAAPSATAPVKVTASDHSDTFENVNRPGADLTDLYVFPSTNPPNVILAMALHPLIPPGQGLATPFDPQVLYQFKIDNTGDDVEDLVLQTRITGTGPNQTVQFAGPAKPIMTGTKSVFGRPYARTGRTNAPFNPTNGIAVFAGGRSDPFFLDFNQFTAIFPDRRTPLTGRQVNFPSIMAADTPQTNGFRGFPPNSGFNSQPAMDFFADLNVLAIVVELPRAALVGAGNGKINVWMTTSLPDGFQYLQQDRLARPAINEVLATVTDYRHAVNNLDNPVEPSNGYSNSTLNGNNDTNQLETDIRTFMNFPAGRSAAITDVLVSVLVPDVMVADLSQMGVPAAYLGVETGGATGSKFGGRALTNDVVDTDLMAIFGPVIPDLGLAPDDGRELPQFETDNVGPHHDYLNDFPYLGNPH